MINTPNQPGREGDRRRVLLERKLAALQKTVESTIPADFPSDVRQAIVREVLLNSKQVLTNFTAGELRHDKAKVNSHIDDSLATARFLIKGFTAKRQRERIA